MKLPAWRFGPFAFLILCFLLSSCTTLASPALQAPPSGQGPLVLMLSGKTGPALYAGFAGRLADSGYRVLLLDGNDFPLQETGACQNKIRNLIKDYSRASGNANGSAAVIGYSLGGAVALSCAAGMQEVAVVVAYYPATRLISDTDACIERLRAPVTVLQGEEDRYLDCCRVEKIRAMHESARIKGKEFELIVYPDAGHGFNLGPMKNKAWDDDSWQRTINPLKKYLP
jgi:dienelactone hydrolase